MRFYKKILFVLITTILFSSCFVVHRGNVSSGPLLNVNDRYVDIARGKAHSFLVFGLGGVENDVLLLDAKKDLFKNRPLERNEYYANFTTDISKKYIFLFVFASNKVTVSAEVLKTGDTSNTTLSKSFKNVMRVFSEKQFFVSENDTFKLGEEVYFKFNFDNYNDFTKHKIVAITKNEVNLKPIFSSEENVVVKINKTYFYSTVKNLNDYKIGEKVKAEVFSGLGGGKYEHGIIIATRRGFAIVQTSSGNYNVPPNKLEHVIK